VIRTLVVDDDYHVAHAHALSVGRVAGFSVVGEAHSAEEARLLIKAERPDLLLLDMYLPDYNGLELVRRLTSESADSAESDASGHVPDFLLVTAARDIESVRSAMKLGAVYYLVKPFTFAALREQLEVLPSVAPTTRTFSRGRSGHGRRVVRPVALPSGCLRHP